MKRRTMTLALASAIAAPGVSFAASKEEPQAEVRKAATYMNMAEVQAGIGMGVKKFKLVRMFETEKALNEFINSGWEFGAQATAAAKTGDKGSSYQGAVAVAPGVWPYQATGDGLALELTAKGTKYHKDGDLN
jgi:lipid-binding SYLF domain-containing protein